MKLRAQQPTSSTRTSRHRAQRQTATGTCAWAHIGHCKGRIDVAHLDQNPFNNAPENRLPLCHSHHALYDRGHIDRENPQMPRFYVDRGGKRRYEFAYGDASRGHRKRERAF